MWSQASARRRRRLSGSTTESTVAEARTRIENPAPVEVPVGSRKLPVPGVVLVLLVMFAGACTGSSTELSLVAGESSEDADALGYAFAGEDIARGAPIITVQAGEEVTLTLENAHGQYFGGAGHSHDLAIVPATDENRENPRQGPAFSEKVLWDAWLGGEMAIFAGDTATITFIPDEPGEYIYVCTIRDHAERGMLGEFIVEG